MTGAMLTIGAVALGGALGGIARHLVSILVAARFGQAALGTFAVNATGALLIGFVAGAIYLRVAITGEPMTAWLFLVTGLVGSYTTVSAFARDTFELFEAGRAHAAVANVVGSVLVCLGCAWLGFSVSAAVTG